MKELIRFLRSITEVFSDCIWKIKHWVKCNKKHIIAYPLVALLFLLWGSCSEYFWKLYMININLETRDYILELSLKNYGPLRFNTQEEINSRVEAGMEDILIDLMAPPHLIGIFNMINREQLQKKKEIIKEGLGFLKHKGNKTKI